MTDADYQKMTNDVRTFPGPKLFLVSGYDIEELSTLTTFLNSIEYTGVEVKFCTVEQLDDTLETVLTTDTSGEPAGNGKLPNTMVFSGMTSTDVQLVMRRFSECGLKRPIFATVTVTNLSFTIKTLLLHLLEEQNAATQGIKNRQ